MSQRKTFEIPAWLDYASSPMKESLGYPTEGIKHDEGKVDYTLIATPGLEAEAMALMFGAKKYGKYNYTLGFDSSRLTAAALRHILAYRDGSDYDTESGVHHLGHARACLGMLLHCNSLGTLRDDRFRGGK